jgi:hypothetical protein
VPAAGRLTVAENARSCNSNRFGGGIPILAGLG